MNKKVWLIIGWASLWLMEPDCFAAARKKLVMYYANWTVDRGCPVTGNLAQAAPDLDVIIYAFADINQANGEVLLSDPAVDVGHGSSWDQSNFYKLTQLKAAHPGLKILLSVGGWSYRDKFKRIVDAKLVKTFATSCAQLLSATTINGTRYAYDGLFDGLDIDWEFDESDPGAYASAYSSLLTTVKAALRAHNESYILTAAIQAGPGMYQGAKKLDLKKISVQLDWINVMTYDFHGTWERTTNIAEPLHGVSTADVLCVDGAISGFMRAGVAANKLVMGISLEGATYQEVPAGKTHGLRQSTKGPATGAILGKYEPGTISYCDVVTHLLSQADKGAQGYTYYWQPKQCASWLYNPSEKTFVSFESQASAREKALYARNKGLAGIMEWEMCADTSGADLTHLIRNTLNG